MTTNLIVNIKNENPKLRHFTRVFARKVKNDLHSYENVPSYVDNCLQCTMHHIHAEQNLGKYRKNKDVMNICKFCLKSVTTNEYIRTLKCGHVFHRKCIDRWIFSLHNDTCPCCSKSILT